MIIGLKNGLSSREEKGLLLKDCGGKKCPYILSVASGKGGVGKTLTVVNFALSLSQSGAKVLILDGDLGMSNVDVVLGLSSKYNIKHILDGHATLEDVLLEGPFGVNVISSGSGISTLANLSIVEKQSLFEQLSHISQEYDYLLIDSGAGIGDNVLHLNSLSHRRLVVSTVDPHSITDAYAYIKVMASERNFGTFDLIINMAQSAREASAVAQRLCDVAKDYLGVNINYLGYVPYDSNLALDVKHQKVAKSDHFNRVANQTWHQMVTSMTHERRQASENVPIEYFWQHLISQNQTSCNV